MSEKLPRVTAKDVERAIIKIGTNQEDKVVATEFTKTKLAKE